VTGATYEYRPGRESFLQPFYRRLIWDRIVLRLPARLSPDVLTLLGIACAAAAFAVAAFGRSEAPWPRFLTFILIFLHMSLDNLDGLHARRTGRSSARGEFLDHWLDTYNAGFVTLASCLACRLPPGATMAMVAASSISFFAVHWAHRHTGRMWTGRVADIEVNTMAALFAFVAGVLGPGRGEPVFFLYCFGVMAGTAVTVASVLGRVRANRADWAPFLAAAGGIVLWYHFRPELGIPLTALMAGLNVVCAGGAMSARLSPAGARKRPQAFLYVLLPLPVLLEILRIPVQPQLAAAAVAAALMLAAIVRDFISTYPKLASRGDFST